MKALKITLIVLGIVLLIITAGYLFPRKMYIERSLTINAPVEMIYDQVNNLYLWGNWSPWHKIDTAMKIEYLNGGIGTGAAYSWTSNHKSVGNGTLTITDAKAFEYINTSMDFGDQGNGTASFKFEAIEGGVKVSWDMHSELPNCPLFRWMGLLMKKSIISAYDRGLADIAAQCEYLQKQDWYYVKIKTKPTTNYYGLSAETTVAEMNIHMKKMFTQLYTDLPKAGIELKEAPFAIYHTWGELVKFECCVPVADNSLPLKGLTAGVLPENNYAVIKYVGPYEGMESPHMFMDSWLKQSQKQVTGPVVEKYKTDPETEPDSSKWVTYILYPVK